MENKERNSGLGLAVAVAGFLGLAACGIVCLTLNRTLKTQRHELSETKAQLAALAQAGKTQERALGETREQLAAVAGKFAEAEKQAQTLSQQITELQSKLRESHSRPVAQAPVPAFQFQFANGAPDVPAADSVEGKLRSEGKRWEQTGGQPVVGDYVQDIMTGRMNQPNGRGSIGKVVFTGANEDGRPWAQVDFGRGYIVGIMLSELSKILFLAPELQ
jgi:hypothetical protein